MTLFCFNTKALYPNHTNRCVMRIKQVICDSLTWGWHQALAHWVSAGFEYKYYIIRSEKKLASQNVISCLAPWISSHILLLAVSLRPLPWCFSVEGKGVLGSPRKDLRQEIVWWDSTATSPGLLSGWNFLRIQQCAKAFWDAHIFKEGQIPQATALIPHLIYHHAVKRRFHHHHSACQSWPAARNGGA